MNVNEDWLGEDDSTDSSSSRKGIGIWMLVFAAIGIAIYVYLAMSRGIPITFTEANYTDSPVPVPVYNEIQTSTFVGSDIERLKAFLKYSDDPPNFFQNLWSGENVKEQLSQDRNDHFTNDENNPAVFYVSFNLWGDSSS